MATIFRKYYSKDKKTVKFTPQLPLASESVKSNGDPLPLFFKSGFPIFYHRGMFIGHDEERFFPSPTRFYSKIF